MTSFLKAASLIALLAASGGAAAAQSGAAAIDGRWDAVLSHDGIAVPFRLDIQGSGSTLKGVFYDGFKPYDGTTSASFQDGKLTLNIEHYLTTIDASLNVDGKTEWHGGDGGPRSLGRICLCGDAPCGSARCRQRAFHHGRLDHSARGAIVQGRKGVPLCRAAKGRRSGAAILRIDGEHGLV